MELQNYSIKRKERILKLVRINILEKKCELCQKKITLENLGFLQRKDNKNIFYHKLNYDPCAELSSEYKERVEV